ncbi:MAG: PH domain-containing protein, partial [Planctomycetota bacterium]
ITRPDRKLLTYYIVVSLLSTVGVLPLTVIVFLPLYFKYRTLQYRFDEQGIAMSWGLLFRREIHLTYRRTQDIHLTRNLVQRWMGLATVAVQTASGSSSPEMKLEGILQASELRDFLYSKMRGAREEESDDAGGGGGEGAAGPGQEALGLLHEIRDAVARLAEPAPDRGSGEPPA